MLGMEIKVLVVPDCPHEKAAVQRLRQALDNVGLHDAEVTTRVITDQAAAERCGFTGSPTVLRTSGHEDHRHPAPPCQAIQPRIKITGCAGTGMYANDPGSPPL